MPAPAKYLWWNGEIVPWDDAKVHVTILGWSTMGAVFEGIKAFWNEDQGELYGLVEGRPAEVANPAPAARLQDMTFT